jgi:tetratricopeptide (TPR) repeat protein
MDWRGKSAALYGRFTAGARARIGRAIFERGGVVVRDLTRRSDVLIVGALATPLVDSGHLVPRLEEARARGIPVCSERRAEQALAGAVDDAFTMPLDTAARQTGVDRATMAALDAFDVIRIEGDACRFADMHTLKTAAEILAAGRTLGDCVRILARARDLAPRGRRRIVIDAHGQAALDWENGVTTLEGQGLLPLDEASATVEELFDAALVAESEGDVETAARLYDMCARADRKDAIALYNLGNLRLGAGDHEGAMLAYSRAVARDPDLVEAHYNLALAAEAARQYDRAREALLVVLDRDARNADALFNLAQIELGVGNLLAARERFEAYLDVDPPADWAEKARKAISYLNARLSA